MVITDIKMPYMNGLELARNLKEENPGVRILILTGFDDVWICQRSSYILKIEEYILKPLNAAEITKVFEDLKKKLDQEINEKKGAELLKRYYKDSLPLLQANFIQHW